MNATLRLNNEQLSNNNYNKNMEQKQQADKSIDSKLINVAIEEIDDDDDDDTDGDAEEEEVEKNEASTTKCESSSKLVDDQMKKDNLDYIDGGGGNDEAKSLLLHHNNKLESVTPLKYVSPSSRILLSSKYKESSQTLPDFGRSRLYSCTSVNQRSLDTDLGLNEECRGLITDVLGVPLLSQPQAASSQLPSTSILSDLMIANINTIELNKICRKEDIIQELVNNIGLNEKDTRIYDALEKLIQDW